MPNSYPRDVIFNLHLTTKILQVYTHDTFKEIFVDECSALGSSLTQDTCIWASSRENMSLGFSTRVDSNRPAQSQKLGRGLKFQVKKLGVLYYLGSE